MPAASRPAAPDGAPPSPAVQGPGLVPNYYPDLVPFGAPPGWAGPAVPLPHAITVTDTTFRDGQQARPPYTAEQIEHLYDLLHQLGGPSGAIRQCEFFLYSRRDREAVERCLARGHTAPEVTGWIRARAEDLPLVRAAGLAETGLLTSCSDHHIYRKLRWTRRQALDEYVRIASAAAEAGIRPRCHLEDVTRADLEGFVVPLVQALGRACGPEGFKLRLCDTLGLGLPFQGVAAPRGVPALVARLRAEGLQPWQLEWHGHNDLHLAVANALAAWLAGCAAANGTLLGFGERTGNPAVEALVMHYVGLTGDAGPDTRALGEIVRFMRDECGYPVPPMTPLAGAQAFSTAAGIHADGLLKDPGIYLPFDPEALFDLTAAVTITDRSGAAGVAAWWHQSFGEEVAKDDPRVRALAAWVQAQYEDGRTTVIADAELRAQAGASPAAARAPRGS